MNPKAYKGKSKLLANGLPTVFTGYVNGKLVKFILEWDELLGSFTKVKIS